MLSEIQRQKFEYLFNVLDNDNNGYLEFADLERYVERLTDLCELKSDSDELKQLQKDARDWWDLIKISADLNNDSQVSLDEWIEFQDNYTSELKENPVGEAYFYKNVEDIFNIIDLDGNGNISIREYRMFLAGWGVNINVEETFKILDFDGNGVITIGEMSQLVWEFYFSDNIKARGNWFYGPIDFKIESMPKGTSFFDKIKRLFGGEIKS